MAKIIAQWSNPDCGAAGYVDEKYAGKEVKCKKCGTTFTIPSLKVDPTEQPTRRVFVSYSHEDSRWFEEDSLIPWLARSLRKDNVETWYDRQGLQAGDEFRRRIEEEIDTAHLALLMISQGFLTSEFIEEVELPRITARAAQGELAVIPILVEPCEWQEIEFISSLQMLPGKPTPLIDYIESDREWAHVRFEILQGIKSRIDMIGTAEPPVDRADSAAAPAEIGAVRVTWEDAAFNVGRMAGQAAARWQPATQLGDANRYALSQLLSGIDKELQQLGLPFPLSGGWPDSVEELSSKIQEFLASKPPPAGPAFALGWNLHMFRAYVNALYTEPDTEAETQAGRWQTAQTSIANAVTNALGLSIPGDQLEELLSLQQMPAPQFDPAEGARFEQRVLQLSGRINEHLRDTGFVVASRGKQAIDRVTPWLEKCFQQ